MRQPSLTWRSLRRWRPDRRRLLKYAAIALGLHVAATILLLPATLQIAENVGERICYLIREEPRSFLHRSGGSDRFLRPRIHGLDAWPLSLEADLLRLAPSLAPNCVVRAYPAGDLRAILFGHIALEIGSENPAQGLVIEFDPAMTVIGHRRWHWPEMRPQDRAAATDSDSPP